MLFSWLLLLTATPFCNSIIASGKLCGYQYFLITVLFVKTKEMSVKKLTFLLHPNFGVFCRKYIVAF